MNANNRRVVGRWTGTAGTEMVWCVVEDGGRIMVEIDTADPMPAEVRPCMPCARLRATPDELREMFKVAARVLEVVERMEVAAGRDSNQKHKLGAQLVFRGPGYPGPCPDGVDWSDWLAMNNVD